MQIKPIERYQPPGYPEQSVLQEHPELLALVPNRWRGNPTVLAALGTLCVLLSGCRSSSNSTPRSIAPIFIHGDGRGSFGCEAVNPPTFLSEDEARHVIVQEAKRSGLDLRPTNLPVLTVRGPQTNTFSHGKKGTRVLSFELDGFDGKRRIGYEYVSETDFQKWQKPWWKKIFEGASSVSSYDMLDAAQVLRNGMDKAKPEGAYAVFYDPCIGRRDVAKSKGISLDPPKNADWEKWQKQMEPVVKNMDKLKPDLAREELRSQVRDFVKWLKAEGVI